VRLLYDNNGSFVNLYYLILNVKNICFVYVQNIVKINIYSLYVWWLFFAYNVKVQNLYSELTCVYKSESTLRKHYLDTIAYFDSLSVCM